LNIAIDSRLAGAAVANSSGEVVGILVADQFGETRTVLPYTAFKSAVYSLLKEGRVISPWFGAISTDLSRAIGYDESYTRGYTKGTLLGTITKDSPAETAGLRRGDIVVSAGGLEISEKQSFDELLADYHVGDTLNLIIDRAGESLKVDVVLGAH
jgi:S1-C subfamily serine protease